MTSPLGTLQGWIRDGQARTAWIATMQAIRAGLDDTAVLARWDDRAAAHPGGMAAHARTLLAVHNADDLVALDLPWWTYDGIATVAAFLAARGPHATAFEYGSGASTVWLARRAARVTSIEHVPGWADRVRALLAAHDLTNATVRVVEAPPSTDPVVGSEAPSGVGHDFADYVAALDDDPGPHDLVVVDGRARVACLERALATVAPDGMVVVDDAQRARYQDAFDAVADAGWRVERHRGLAPCEPLPRDTVTITRR